MERFDREYYDYISRYDQPERTEIEQDLLQNPKRLMEYYHPVTQHLQAN